MTKAQQIQYRRFTEAGYSPEDAKMLIECGVWLGTMDLSAQNVTDIQRYRAERDKRAQMSAESGEASAGRSSETPKG